MHYLCEDAQMKNIISVVIRVNLDKNLKEPKDLEPNSLVQLRMFTFECIGTADEIKKLVESTTKEIVKKLG